MTDDLSILTATSVDELGADLWDNLSAGRAFQSARWYRFGELSQPDCPPVYIIVSLHDRPIARGTFWLVRNEPLPVSPFMRIWLAPLLRRRPLLICRSPLSNSSGLILPEGPLREAALSAIVAQAQVQARRRHCSFLMFDYIDPAQLKAAWPAGCRSLEVPGPGTSMRLEWPSFEAYLLANGRKNRQDFWHSQREMEKAGIQIDRLAEAPDIDQALGLIRRVEKTHGSAANPWIMGMLEHLPMVGGCIVQASTSGRLVGCGLLLYDGDTQLALALGHTRSAPHVYFRLLYASLEDAFEKHVRHLRWGSGAYEVKTRLGFQQENNNHIIFHGEGRLAGLIARLAAG